VSGTSAGAMNAVVLAHGLMVGEREGAREALRRFWSRVSNASGHPGLLPYQSNPLDLNPLRESRQPELTVEVVMASACLPLMFRAVEIEGEAYWDGGYVGNPSLGVRPCSPTWGAVPRWTWAPT